MPQKKFHTFLFFLLIIAVGAGVFTVLKSRRQRPKKHAQVDKAPLVEVVTVRAQPQEIRIRAQGTVIAAQSIALQAEIGGRITHMNPQLVVGGVFKKGDTLMRIDSRAYSVAVHQGLASVQGAQVNLDLEKGRKEVAEREWVMLYADSAAPKKEAGALALREPQLETAKVEVSVAQSQLDRARLDLERTRIRAPFDGFVTEESVDVGQLLAPGTVVGRLVASDRFWVQVSVPLDLIGSIPIPPPGAQDHELGAKALITQTIGGRRVERHGHVLRMLSDVDPLGRLARYVVRVEDPLGFKSAQEDSGASTPRLPMLLGSYVNVEIVGLPLESAIEIPRIALHNNDMVYVVDAGCLMLTKVQVIWRRKESVLISAGLKDGAQVILSRLSVPLEGMKLRIAEKKSREGQDAERENGTPSATETPRLSGPKVTPGDGESTAILEKRLEPGDAEGAADRTHSLGDKPLAQTSAMQ